MYLQASDLFNERIAESGRTFRAKLICGNEVIDSGINSVGIYGGSNSGDTITIGSTISQRIEVEMVEPDVNLAGKEWELKIGFLMSDKEDVEYIPMGLFTPEKPVTDNGKTKFTAYDRMLKLSGIYTCTLSVINTITVLNDISVKTGVPINTTSLALLPMDKPEGFTYREVLMYIAQKYGKFANVDRKGIIQFYWWSEITGYKVMPNNTNGFSHDGNEFVLEHISCSTGQNEDGTVISITAGKGVRGIFISNPFMTQNELDEVYKSINGFSYTVSSVNMPIGDLRLDPWDMVTVYDIKGNAYKIPLMTLEFQYDGGVSASFSCVGYSEIESQIDYKGPMAQFQDRIEASVAKLGILVAKSASIEDLEALRIRVDSITAVEITTEYLEANYASLDNLLAVTAKVNRIQSDYINTINLEAKVAELGYAKIDFANVSVESVGKLFADVGILNEVTIVNGNITGILNGVRINADVITVGTLSVDRLLVTGKDSIVYQLNVESSGLSATELEKEVYQKYLNGTDIVANSITANQIAAKTITAAEINVTDLFAQDIKATGTISGATLTGAMVEAIEFQCKKSVAFYSDIVEEKKELIYMQSYPSIYEDLQGNQVLSGYITDLYMGLDTYEIDEDGYYGNGLVEMGSHNGKPVYFHSIEILCDLKVRGDISSDYLGGSYSIMTIGENLGELERRFDELNSKFIIVDIPFTITKKAAGASGYAKVTIPSKTIPSDYTPKIWSLRTGSISALNGSQITIVLVTNTELWYEYYCPNGVGSDIYCQIYALCKQYQLYE